MNVLTGFLIAVELVISILLILIILVQPSKSGGGLGGAAFGGGGMGEQLFGARAGNVLTKGTVIFTVIFLVNTMALALVYSRQTGVQPLQTLEPAPATGLSGLPTQQMEMDFQELDPVDTDFAEEDADLDAADTDEAVEGDEAFDVTPDEDAEIVPDEGDDAADDAADDDEVLELTEEDAEIRVE
ncbi:MAG: preprotein translocase subunit SecG [Verrucomicrobia bacterium]|nr:preprotein translocase subunit SecG [Verrucomicrobiota bacterium]MCH8512303.1 preprotein translocase subunit SecG [Kiritimatiellia bacterium]